MISSSHHRDLCTVGVNRNEQKFDWDSVSAQCAHISRESSAQLIVFPSRRLCLTFRRAFLLLLSGTATSRPQNKRSRTPATTSLWLKTHNLKYYSINSFLLYEKQLSDYCSAPSARNTPSIRSIRTRAHISMRQNAFNFDSEQEPQTLHAKCTKSASVSQAL